MASARLTRDALYPGTAVARMHAARARASSLSKDDLSSKWEEVRRKLLWACGLRDLPNAQPGKGYTGHAFNDSNHCDATTMLLETADNENEGRVAGIARRNPLGDGIKIASDPSIGEGGTWCTCMQGCNQDPPQDVAHIQFQSRIAWKLVWCPPEYESFCIVDDEGNLLNSGKPTGPLPHLFHRKQNYSFVKGSKYARAANELKN
eukprot:g3195.t1